jgi:RNA polymerase sigma factor (sigma-70 family)
MNNEELAVLIQSGQHELLPELWQQVERFAQWRADKLARKLDGRYGITAEDLYQCGYLALAATVQSFRIEKEGSFIGWFDLYLKREYASLGGWRTEREKNDPINHAASLDMPVDVENEDSSTLGELQNDPSAEEAFLDVEEQDRIQRLHNVIEALLQEMPEQQVDVIRLRFYHGLPLKEVGEALGISADRVRSMEAKALRFFRASWCCQKLRQHWG